MMFRFNKLLIILLLFFCMSCTQKKQQPFSFVQLSDPQLGMGGYEHDVNTFKLAVKQINELKPDFVIICGDLVHHRSDSSFADFLEIKKDFKMPCYLVAGNHDIGKVPNNTSLTYYREKLGKDYYQFNHKGYSFIVTNSLLWKNNIEKESEKHYKWFKETVRKSNSKIVVGHFPLYIKNYDEQEEYFNIPPGKRMELLNLFADNNVKAYLSGHKHEVLINNYKNIQLVTGETTSKNFDKRPMGFRYWEVSPDTMKHYFIPLQNFQLNKVKH